MKEKIHYAIEAALVVAVIILFVLQFTGNKNATGTNMAVSDGEDDSKIMSIAYIEMDSLMLTYALNLDLNEQITKKIESSQATLTEKMRKLQSEANEYQRKAEAGAFLTRERMQSEEQRIMKMQEDVQQLDAKLSQELAEEQSRLRQQLRTTIITHLNEYNKDKGYQLIYGKSNDYILYANPIYDVTAEVIEYLNKQYAASQEKPKE
jgi:outer membrane protein